MATSLPTTTLSLKEAAAKETPRLGFLDGLRALAAFFVVFRHSWQEIWPAAGNSSPFWARLLYTGHTYVDLFIVLSGFCLMLPVVRGNGVLRGGVLAFIKKRARRILPPYYCALAFSLLLIFSLIGKQSGTVWDLSLPVTWHGLLTHLLLLQDFSPHEFFQVNYAFWSISFEWWMYFLFPALVWAWKRFRPVLATGLSIALAYALCAFCHRVFDSSYTLQYIALFTLGMLGSELVYTRSPTLRRLRDQLPWELVTWITAALAILAVAGRIPYMIDVPRIDALVGLWAMCLLVNLGVHPSSLLNRVLSQKPFVFVGSFGYSIYLIHAPLIQVIWQYALRPLHLAQTPAFLLLEIVGTPLIIAVSYGFFLLCERPFMNAPGRHAVKTESQIEAAAITNPAP